MAPPERKRANVFGDDDSSLPSSPSKKLKGNSQGVPSFVPPPASTLPPPQPTVKNAALAAEIAAKQAAFKAKFGAMTARGGLAAAAAPPPPPPSSLPPPPPRPSTLPPVPGLPKPNLDPDLAKKVAEAKKLVESMQARKAAAAAKPVNPYLPTTAPKKNDPVLDPSIAAHGGLAMAAHPLLMDTSAPVAQTKKERYKPMVPKFSTTKANARLPPPPPKIAPPPVAPEPDLVDTPFYDTRLGYGSAGTSGKAHMGRGQARTTLKFNQKGKFVKLGEAIRAEARMEDLKKRILEGAKKAGLESELEDQAKAIKRPPPPDVEWWDTPFLPEKTYDSFDSSYLDTSGAITIYVQHPIQIPAPQDKIKIESKPLMLTPKEMKKMRRQRRQRELEDKQDRIKMGLLAPAPPKVRLSNMMRVLTQDAIADPTKVEAKVRREMEARQKGHLKMNAERKLSDESRREKEEEKKQKDEAKGIHAACFKIRYLSNKYHKNLIRMNAEQQNMTGVVLFNPKFNLVVVEGGIKAIKFFQRLMLVRIKWTEESLNRDSEASTSASAKTEEGIGGPMDELEEPESLADNYCKLVWKGEHREKLFRYFKLHNCPSEAKAKEVLGSKLEELWDAAKNEVYEEDE